MQDELRKHAGIERLTDSEYSQLMSTDRRRTTLEVLPELSNPVELETLAEAVAVRETDADSLSEDQIKQVAVTLHHVHLPKMAELDVIDYDPAASRIGLYR
jgi:hypothetical protein